MRIIAAHRYPTRAESQTHEGRYIRAVAYGLKRPCEVCLDVAADEMAALVPHSSALIPIPDSTGNTQANLALAKRLATLTDSTVKDVLYREPSESSCRRRLAGLKGLATEQIKMVVQHTIGPGTRVLVDNVATTGATGLAAARAILGQHGEPILLVWAACGSLIREEPFNAPGPEPDDYKHDPDPCERCGVTHEAGHCDDDNVYPECPTCKGKGFIED